MLRHELQQKTNVIELATVRSIFDCLPQELAIKAPGTEMQEFLKKIRFAVPSSHDKWCAIKSAAAADLHVFIALKSAVDVFAPFQQLIDTYTAAAVARTLQGGPAAFVTATSLGCKSWGRLSALIVIPMGCSQLVASMIPTWPTSSITGTPASESILPIRFDGFNYQ